MTVAYIGGLIWRVLEGKNILNKKFSGRLLDQLQSYGILPRAFCRNSLGFSHYYIYLAAKLIRIILLHYFSREYKVFVLVQLIFTPVVTRKCLGGLTSLPDNQCTLNGAFHISLTFMHG